MTELMTSAPGKVVLSGEYAVLDGAPAIAMAVNRRAIVAVEEKFSGGQRVQSRGLPGKPDRSLFDCLVRELSSDSTDGRSFMLDTSEFVDDASGSKLGIGSSAALMVALAKAFVPSGGDQEIGELAARAHREFQGGIGSGIDIATSVSGGLIEYRMDGSLTSTIHWPENLKFALLWSGVSASTCERVKLLAASNVGQSRARLSAMAEETALAWQSGDADAISASYGRYIEALMDFSVDHDLGIFEAGHDVLLREARAGGLVYKPCGAGGGDIGIALTTDALQLNAFVDRARDIGFKYIDVDLDDIGVQLAREQI